MKAGNTHWSKFQTLSFRQAALVVSALKNLQKFHVTQHDMRQDYNHDR